MQVSSFGMSTDTLTTRLEFMTKVKPGTLIKAYPGFYSLFIRWDQPEMVLYQPVLNQHGHIIDSNTRICHIGWCSIVPQSVIETFDQKAIDYIDSQRVNLSYRKGLHF